MKDHASKLCIVTHNNQFHMDDVIACFMLKTMHPTADIVRTRDPQVIEGGDYAVDVGDVYSPERRRYDHHQRGFTQTYNEHTSIKMSSAGLVFKHHGEEFLEKIGIPLGEHKDAIISLIYTHYFMSVDANDNGVDVSGSPKYRQRTLDDIVKTLNPSDFPEGSSYPEQEEIRLTHFYEAMRIMGADLTRFCREVAKNVQKSSTILNQAYLTSCQEKYVVLEKSCGFRDMVEYYNRKYGREVYIVIYPRLTDNGKIYSLLCTSKEPLRFKPEMPLCERWRGLRSSELCKEEEMKDAIFVHASGFCGSAKSRKTAIHMAKEAIKEYEANQNTSRPK
jgi:uncharacterized UPF0160 family protein